MYTISGYQFDEFACYYCVNKHVYKQAVYEKQLAERAKYKDCLVCKIISHIVIIILIFIDTAYLFSFMNSKLRHILPFTRLLEHALNIDKKYILLYLGLN